ncbi:MAG: alpha-amylase [Muribaculaceae bacterium]|nr:alpha-amylase [Muribaculaceae bacterium]
MTPRIDSSVDSHLNSSPRKNERLVVYQFFPRILTNPEPDPMPYGSLERNGSGKFNHLTSKVIKGIKNLGVNALWLTGVIEHATKTDFSEFGIKPDHKEIVKGEAGSPYAIKDYFDVDPALAENVEKRIDEFKAAVKRIHKEGLKVLIDFVPNHTARCYHSDKAPAGEHDFGADDDREKFFSPSNNYYYIQNQEFHVSRNGAKEFSYTEIPAKATGNDCFSAVCSEFDWYETVKLNYGKDYSDGSEHFDPIPDTWKKMTSILRYWAEMGVDGFRCDMVFMVPLPFWHYVIPELKKDFPHLIFIGEIYDVGQYRDFLGYGCFDYLYDKVNLYDTLVGIERHGLSASRLTDCWKTVDGIGSQMLNFLENHDEVRFCSPEYAGDAARIVPHLVVSSMISKGPFMIYYGQELGEKGADNEGFAGQNNRTTIFDYWSVASLRRWYSDGKADGSALTPHEKNLRKFFSKVLKMLNSRSALREGEFFDLMYANDGRPGFDGHSLFAWLRHDEDEALLIVANFSRDERFAEIHIPELAFDMARLPEFKGRAKDLLFGETFDLEVSRHTPLKIKIPGSSAVVIPLREQNQNNH